MRILALVLLSAARILAAVSFDAVTVGVTESIGTSITWSHTCAAGADLYVFADSRSGGVAITGVTAGGTAMTLVAQQTVFGNTSHTAYRLGGCSGATTIVVSGPFSYLSGNSISFLGSNGPNANSVGTGSSVPSGTTYTATVTSTVANCLLVVGYREDFGSGATLTGGTNTTMRISTGSTLPEIATSTTAVSSGSNSLNATSNQLSSWASIIIAIAPVSTSSPQASVF
jgi:hypothetical protein